MYTILKCLGKRVIQTNPSKFYERLKERDRDRETETAYKNSPSMFWFLKTFIPDFRPSEGFVKACPVDWIPIVPRSHRQPCLYIA